MLTVIAERDHIVPEPVAAPLPDLVGSEDSDVLRLDAGHIGLVVGRTAAKVTIPHDHRVPAPQRLRAGRAEPRGEPEMPAPRARPERLHDAAARSSTRCPTAT